MPNFWECAVVGGGAAGLSAGLILGRSKRRVLVCDDGRPRNAVASAVHGFLSREGINPTQLLRIAKEELAQYPSVSFRAAHIVDAGVSDGCFAVTDQNGGTFVAARLLLATGVYDELPKIEGLAQFWGRAAFVCPYCDAWEYRGRCIVVIGPERAAGELATELRQWTQNVRAIDQSSVTRIQGDRMPEIVLTDGSTSTCDAIFLAAPLRLRFPLVDSLGLQVRDEGEILVDECGRTSLRGCYAAGDAVTTAHQLMLAAASGIRAAMAINEDLLDDQNFGDITASSPG
jgi:thioredoxin reductase